jgi:hypothetical protein
LSPTRPVWIWIGDQSRLKSKPSKISRSSTFSCSVRPTGILAYRFGFFFGTGGRGSEPGHEGSGKNPKRATNTSGGLAAAEKTRCRRAAVATTTSSPSLATSTVLPAFSPVGLSLLLARVLGPSPFARAACVCAARSRSIS